ncbi:PREDICTED: uncharacterized protein LOC105458780 [Wasmannia auropunctata]|uniref:uncharacterized protein LOC105458780 n=1 Tax=Wasmannia auropunctata TaxID=64793 RepID=UPI0005EEAC31|nr:PREDICTED: uncharacterized protein LOC105458780 [Wasmannia auropunctata]
MEEDAGPSTSQELSDIEERSFLNENFKGEFTNALLIAKSIYEERNLLTNKPPEKISSVSLAMAEEISKATINVLNEHIVIVDEELILFDESDDEGNFKEKEKVVALAQAHPKWNLATLKKQGANRLKHKDYLQRWKEDIKKGGTRLDKWEKINSETFERFNEARCRLEQVTTRTLQQWAMATAFPFLSEDFKFQASSTWVTVFKRKHKIKQRKITKFVSKRDIATLEETVQAAEKFQRQTKCLISKFDLDFVINTDQTGCQYEMTYNRSLDFNRVKTVFVQKQSLNKLTHSYTAQYSVTASGKLLPLVFLCLQEPTNKFGPTVSKKSKN